MKIVARFLLLLVVSSAFVSSLIFYNKSDIYVEHHPEFVDYASDDVISTQAERSHKWPTARNNYLKSHPECEACGTRDNLNVHHIIPFHEDPSKELDPTNMITLCREHHFKFGHRCNDGKSNWGLCSNPNVRRDVAEYRKSLR